MTRLLFTAAAVTVLAVLVAPGGRQDPDGGQKRPGR